MAKLPKTANPEAVEAPAAGDPRIYISAIASSLRPVFLVAACIAVLAFALTWLLRDVPLRTKSAEDLGEAFAAPSPAD